MNEQIQNTEQNMGCSAAGVFSAVKKNGGVYFRASLTYRRKHISLGSFASVDAAHAAYLEGGRILGDPHCAISSYSERSPLSFEKWVCLINFRDNGLYISNPIYVSKKLFYYYLSPTRILKFDPDDLFYYSSHKIMHRGNHYFVADYGMQISVTSRHGIKAYAKEGRDFRFINGDNTDFRRENLEIYNIYHGVSRELIKGEWLYAVRIHIVGNTLVGRYPTEAEAAIAYNKAIDLLQRNGVKKNYTPNYIEGLSPRRYAELYAELSVSPRISRYRSKK